MFAQSQSPGSFLPVATEQETGCLFPGPARFSPQPSGTSSLLAGSCREGLQLRRPCASPRVSPTRHRAGAFRSPAWLCLLLLHLFLHSPQIKIKQPTTPCLFFVFKYPYINYIKGGRHTYQLPFHFCPALLVLGVPRSKRFVPGRGSMSRLSM